MKEEKYDVVILGAGPAGLSAAIYATRYGLRTVIIAKEIGGMANLAHQIENYPGYEGPGRELMQRFYKQALKHGVEYLNEDILKIEKKIGFCITTKAKKLTGKTVIIALGTEKRKLNIPGEDKLMGRGVSYCATCDAHFFKNKDVAVVGGGDSAWKAAILLSGIANKVYIIYRGCKEKCEAVYSDELKKKNNVKFMYNTAPMEIRGKDYVEELVVEVAGKLKNLPGQEKIRVDGVFIEAGGLPVTDIAKMLKVRMDKKSYIHVDHDMNTNIRGIFAAGDVVKSKLKQVIVAASQGALAAKSAFDYLKEKR